MSCEVSAGNAGPKVRGDCLVSFDLDAASKLDLQISSSVQSMFGDAIKALAQKIIDFYGIQQGRLVIKDSGAFDFVLAARLEACLRKALSSEKKCIPDMLPENLYNSNKDRMRTTRLYVPGNSPKMMINAGVHKPHGVILDLEDSVSPEKKDEARILVRNALRQVDFYGAERMVRINKLPLGLQDLEEVAENMLHVVLIPKCESADDIRQVNETLERIRQEKRLSHDIYLVPIIESAKGILNLENIVASADNIVAMSLGLEDFASDLGITRSTEGTEALYARSSMVTVCRGYGIQAIDSVFSNVHDLEGLHKAATRSKSLGFSGLSCIHPSQIKVVHKAFAPSQQELDKAKGIIEAFEIAQSTGKGVVAYKGKMIDAPVVQQARQTIHTAHQLRMF